MKDELTELENQMEKADPETRVKVLPWINFVIKTVFEVMRLVKQTKKVRK